MHGDFNRDGIDDLAFASPHDDPFVPPVRQNAGTLHIVLGQIGGWPSGTEYMDLAPANYPDDEDISIIEIYGANGQGVQGDSGDTLAYSGAFGDMNGDGAIDIITNEMEGNGTAPGTTDVGNLLLIDLFEFLKTDALFSNGFESD